MALEVLAKVGTNASGHPIHLVRCPFCKHEYRRVGRKSDLQKYRGCASCGQLAKKNPLTPDEAEDIMRALRRECAPGYLIG